MIERLPDPVERLPDPDPPPERAGSLQWVGMLSVAVVAIVADQVTKRLVTERVGMDEVHQVLPFLDVRHVRNTGHRVRRLPRPAGAGVRGDGGRASRGCCCTSPAPARGTCCSRSRWG